MTDNERVQKILDKLAQKSGCIMCFWSQSAKHMSHLLKLEGYNVELKIQNNEYVIVEGKL